MFFWVKELNLNDIGHLNIGNILKWRQGRFKQKHESRLYADSNNNKNNLFI